jgi:hypothetical protein
MLRRRLAKYFIITVLVLIGAMWVYAFGFASRESFNRINDESWKVRTEAACQKAEDDRFALQDLSAMDPNDADDLAKKAKIVDAATDSLEQAINSIASDIPTDAKGQALVPQWLNDYRTYIGDRRNFANELRTSDRRPFFAETELEGVPISEKIGKFARENDIRTCQPPLDLSV